MISKYALEIELKTGDRISVRRFLRLHLLLYPPAGLARGRVSPTFISFSFTPTQMPKRIGTGAGLFLRCYT